jgi:DNA-directed RNA polymerase specialized sigma24 family protein
VRHSLVEPSAFGVVYERHGGEVARFLARRVGDGLAEDLAAEVFVRAFRGRAGYRVVHGTALPWLLGIAVNVVAGHQVTLRLTDGTSRSVAVHDNVYTVLLTSAHAISARFTTSRGAIAPVKF